MLDYIPLAIIILVTLIVGLLIYRLYAPKSAENNKKKSHFHHKDRKLILRETQKRLSQNPKDPEALSALADLYFREGAYEKSMKTYLILQDICSTNPELDEFEITLRYGLSALKSKAEEEAYKSLVIARSMKQDVFEVNFNLGYLEYRRKNYEKAVSLLQQAKQADPDHTGTLRYLGQSLFKMKQTADANVILKKVVDQEPDDKESVYYLAQTYYELGQNDQAIKIFTHLRPDPLLGPSAALFSGTIHLNQHENQKAIMDFEIGLKHQAIKPEIQLELKYRLAGAYIKEQEIQKALALLTEIQNTIPDYKDTFQLLKNYQELNENKNLQIFLLSPISEFITLCRKLTGNILPKTKVKIIDISVFKNEYVDILAEVHSSKWEDIILYRYIRTTNTVGELLLREFHARLKDLKAGRGFVLTIGSFSDEAKQFVEARLIDLLEKEKVLMLLKRMEVQLVS